MNQPNDKLLSLHITRKRNCAFIMDLTNTIGILYKNILYKVNVVWLRDITIFYVVWLNNNAFGKEAEREKKYGIHFRNGPEYRDEDNGINRV